MKQDDFFDDFDKNFIVEIDLNPQAPLDKGSNVRKNLDSEFKSEKSKNKMKLHLVK